jgi:hypothetical protein
VGKKSSKKIEKSVDTRNAICESHPAHGNKTLNIMRTKTMLLSALLGTLGSVSLMAQSTNVYSLNAVGYINITAEPGFNIISCPLIASPDNTINTLLTNSTGQYKKWQFYAWNPTTGAYTEDIGGPAAWGSGGAETLNPGQAGWLYNPSNTPVTITFVGTVPSGTNAVTLLPASFNLVSSILPTSGDIVTNGLMNFTNGVKKDQVYMWNTSDAAYTETIAGPTGWPGGDPIQTNVGGGFWYYNAQATNNYWTESFSVNQ